MLLEVMPLADLQLYSKKDFIDRNVLPYLKVSSIYTEWISFAGAASRSNIWHKPQ